MYEEADEEQYNQQRFMASIQGVDLDEGNPERGSRQDADDLTFKDPEDYSHLSQEEREELTKKMMSKFKNMVLFK